MFNKDETRVLTSSEDKTARLWDARTGQQIGPLTHQESVSGAVFNKDETRILTSSEDKTARLWDARTGQQIGASLMHQGAVDAAMFSRDETRILTWSEDNMVRLWDVRTRQQLDLSLTHRDLVRGGLFNKDETRILTWSHDKTARLWDSRTGQRIGAPLTHAGGVIGAVFHKDESRILTWSSDKTARLWDARTGQQIGAPFIHPAMVAGVVVNKDETRILTWTRDTSRSQSRPDTAARLWFLDADPDFPAEHVPLWIRAVTGTKYDFVGRRVETIEPDAWRALKAQYQKIASEHAKTCKYPDANQWRRFHPQIELRGRRLFRSSAGSRPGRGRLARSRLLRKNIRHVCRHLPERDASGAPPSCDHDIGSGPHSTESVPAPFFFDEYCRIRT